MLPDDLFSEGDGAELRGVRGCDLPPAPARAELRDPGSEAAVCPVLGPLSQTGDQAGQLGQTLGPASQARIVQAVFVADVHTLAGDVPAPAALHGLPVKADRLQDGDSHDGGRVAGTVDGVAEVLTAVTSRHVGDVQHELVVPG